MKKVLTILLVAMLTIVGQTAMAQGNSHGKGKGKGRPSFVDEKHRAHAEWKREKAYAKNHKKSDKYHDDDCDRHHDHDDDDRDHRREDDRRVADRDYPWERTTEQRRTEERRRTEEQRRAEEQRREGGDRTIRDVILRRTGGN